MDRLAKALVWWDGRHVMRERFAELGFDPASPLMHRLATLVEVHDEAELERAVAVDPDCLGVNARDLTTFHVDVAHIERMLPQIPAACTAEVDIRVPDLAAAEDMHDRMRALRPIGPDTEISVSGGINRPPFAKDAGIAALFEHAQRLAKELGFELGERTSGGISDGNFTAALGIPTLDGLGADGKDHHTLAEHILYSSLEPRAKLWVRLLETLT